MYRVHRAGPREKIYFRPEDVKAAIVTCGGLCPGLNDVIRHVGFAFLSYTCELYIVLFFFFFIIRFCNVADCHHVRDIWCEERCWDSFWLPWLL